MSQARDWNEHNRKVIEQFRANGGIVGDGKIPHVLLTTTGAKSGLTRVNPLNYTTDGDRIIVIASKGGADTHPDWYHNLVANPAVTVEVGTERFAARARTAAGEERERLYNAQAAQMSYFATYQQKAKRQIPLVILERVE